MRPVAQIRRIQPCLVELRAAMGSRSAIALVQARHEQSSDAGLSHALMRTIPWTAAILAGGQARRLGGVDKSALVVGTRSILERQLSLLRGSRPTS